MKFLERNNFSIRKTRHLRQPLPKEEIESLISFFHEVIKKRRELDIYEDEQARIINYDEKPIFLEMADSTTIDIKGKKEIIINSNRNEKKNY